MLVSDNETIRACNWSFRNMSLNFEPPGMACDHIGNLSESVATPYRYEKGKRHRRSGLWFSYAGKANPGKVHFYYRTMAAIGWEADSRREDWIKRIRSGMGEDHAALFDDALRDTNEFIVNRVNREEGHIEPEYSDWAKLSKARQLDAFLDRVEKVLDGWRPAAGLIATEAAGGPQLQEPPKEMSDPTLTHCFVVGVSLAWLPAERRPQMSSKEMSISTPSRCVGVRDRHLQWIQAEMRACLLKVSYME